MAEMAIPTRLHPTAPYPLLCGRRGTHSERPQVVSEAVDHSEQLLRSLPDNIQFKCSRVVRHFHEVVALSLLLNIKLSGFE